MISLTIYRIRCFFLIVCWFKERYSLPAPFYSCLFCSNLYFKIVGLSRFNYICYVSYCLVTSTVPELISDVIFLHLSLLTPRFLGCKKNVRHHAINQFTVNCKWHDVIKSINLFYVYRRKSKLILEEKKKKIT